MKRQTWLAACVAALGAVAIGHSAAPADTTPVAPGLDGFSERVIDGVRLAVGPRAAALAPNGTVHVVYGNTLLRHAWNAGASWSEETLDGTHARGAEASLAVDAAGHLHVAYSDPRRGELYYGTNAAGAFASRVVATGVRGTPRSAIAVDGSGAVQVAWLDDFGTSLHVTSNATGTFTATTVASDVGYSSDVDLALDSSGAPHVVFMSQAAIQSGVPGRGVRALVHATRGASGWTREDVESGNDSAAQGVGCGASLAFEPGGTLHVVYVGATDASGTAVRPVRHARRPASAWEIETVATVRSERTRLVVAGGELHVASYNWIQGRYFHGGFGAWTTTSLPDAKSGTSIVVAGTTVHVAIGDTKGTYVATSVAGGAFATTTLDRTSEPLVAPAIAADEQASPRIAVVRDDAAGAHLDVLRRNGTAWRTDVVATGVSTTDRVSLRVDKIGATHVAFKKQDGTVWYASDVGGSWQSRQARVSTQTGAVTFALAIAPDGSWRIVSHDPSSTKMGLDTAGGGVPIADTTKGNVPCDIEIADDGTTHVAWIDPGGRVFRASNDSGAWTSSSVADAEGGWGAPTGPDLVLDAAGHEWIAFAIAWQFYDFADVATNRDGTWKTFSIGFASDVVLGFAPDGTGRAVGGANVIRLRETASGWTSETLDSGPGALRAFDAATATVTEGGRPAVVGIGMTHSQTGGVALLGTSIDVGGGVQGAYVDPQTGDLRYVTDRDPGRAATGGVDVVVAGGDASASDATFTPTHLAFGDDDSGTKHVTVTAPVDGVDEPDETLVLALANPTGGVVVGTPSPTSIKIVDADPTPPPPPPPPPPVDYGSYFLPTTARLPATGGVVASGVLEVGAATFDPTAPGQIAFGTRTVAVSGLVRRHGAWTWSAPGARFTLRLQHGSSTRYRFDLRLPRASTEPDVSAGVDFSYTTATLTASSRVDFTTGRIDLAHGVGYFEKPQLHLDLLAATSGARGTVSLVAYLADFGAVPARAPTVTFTIGSAFATTVAAKEFHAAEASWVAGNANRSVTVDYARGVVRATFRRTAVTAPPEGVSTIDVSVDIGRGARTLRTTVTTKRGRFGN